MSENFIACALCLLVLALSAMLLVMTLGIAGCIESEAFKSTRTVIVVSGTAEAEKALDHAR